MEPCLGVEDTVGMQECLLVGFAEGTVQQRAVRNGRIWVSLPFGEELQMGHSDQKQQEQDSSHLFTYKKCLFSLFPEAKVSFFPLSGKCFDKNLPNICT
jgi:hypothetical protein